MKHYKQSFILVIVCLIMIPQITFASWWNPFTWFRKTPPAKIEQTQPKPTPTTVTPLAKPPVNVASPVTLLPKVAPKPMPVKTAVPAVPKATTKTTQTVQSSGNMSVKVTIDENGDGIPENTIYNTDGTLDRAEWEAKVNATYGGDILPRDPLGWPVKLKSTVPITGSIDSLPGMVVVRVIPTMNGATEFTLIISGFPANMDLHVYTQGYRVHEVIRSNPKGEIVFTLPPARGYQYIVKETES
jgi:hypothetical protein